MSRKSRNRMDTGRFEGRAGSEPAFAYRLPQRHNARPASDPAAPETDPMEWLPPAPWRTLTPTTTKEGKNVP